MTTAAARRLTEAHRQSQLHLRNRTLLGLRPLWPLLRWEALDRTFPVWFAAVAGLLLESRSESAALAATYLRAFRQAEGVPGLLQVVLAPQPKRAELELVLRVSSVIAARTFARSGGLTAPAPIRDRVIPSRRVTAAQAMAKAEVRTLGAAGRLVLAGGRETVTETVRGDSRAVGYARVTDGSPCAFCAMLATRGPVYTSRTVGQSDPLFVGKAGRIKVHNHCGCQPEPVYGKWTPPPIVRANQALYAEATRGTSGRDSIRAFERAYRARARQAEQAAIEKAVRRAATDSTAQN